MKPQDELAFGKENYRILIISAVVIVIGFLLMVGGGTDNPNEFHYDEIFSPIRITVAPIVVLIGFVLAMVGIMKKPKDSPED